MVQICQYSLILVFLGGAYAPSSHNVASPVVTTKDIIILLQVATIINQTK